MENTMLFLPYLIAFFSGRCGVFLFAPFCGRDLLIVFLLRPSGSEPSG